MVVMVAVSREADVPREGVPGRDPCALAAAGRCRPIFDALRRYVAGPVRAREESSWRMLAHVLVTECADPVDDAKVRAVLAARAVVTDRARAARI